MQREIKEESLQERAAYTRGAMWLASCVLQATRQARKDAFATQDVKQEVKDVAGEAWEGPHPPEGARDGGDGEPHVDGTRIKLSEGLSNVQLLQIFEEATPRHQAACREERGQADGLALETEPEAMQEDAAGCDGGIGSQVSPIGDGGGSGEAPRA